MVVSGEISAPSCRAISFDDDDLDRIAKEANNTNYGLAASVWTRDLGIAHKLARRIRSRHGVDQYAQLRRFVALPFMAAAGEQGWGREMGKEVRRNFTPKPKQSPLL